MTKWVYPNRPSWFKYSKIKVLNHINRTKKKTHMILIISINVEAAFDKIQY